MNRISFLDYHLPATATCEERDGSLVWLWNLAAVGDALIAFLAMVSAFAIRFTFIPSAEENLLLWDYGLHISLGVISLVLIQFSRGLYQRENLLNRRHTVFKSFASAIIWLPVFLGATLILDFQPNISRLFAIVSGGILAITLPLWRLAQNHVLTRDNVFDALRKNVLVIGWNRQLDRLFAHTSKSRRCPYRITACTPDQVGNYDTPPPEDISRLPSLSVLQSALKSGRFDTVIVGDFNLSHEELLQLNRLCGEEMVELMILPNFMNVFLSGLNIRTEGSVPLMCTDRLPLEQPANLILKRLVDIAGGIAGLLLSAPILAVFCFLVYRESPGPVFYKQLRVGKDGRPFYIYKIRSMRINADKEQKGFSTENDPRRLKIGGLMRRLNIDELPQFWNVVRGEMSLVGPRPERPELIKDFKGEIEFYNLRHSVKPGITGWAQVNGWRGNTDLTPRIQHDLEYMERWSLWFDLYILLKTPFSHQNAY